MHGIKGEPLLTWTLAEQDCIDRGGHLASMHSHEDWSSIEAVVQQQRKTDFDNNLGRTATWGDMYYEGFWIGLNDREVCPHVA
jgi:hypothetical protein